MSVAALLCTLSSSMYRHIIGRGAADFTYRLVLALSDLSTIARYGCSTTCNMTGPSKGKEMKFYISISVISNERCCRVKHAADLQAAANCWYHALYIATEARRKLALLGFLKACWPVLQLAWS